MEKMRDIVISVVIGVALFILILLVLVIGSYFYILIAPPYQIEDQYEVFRDLLTAILAIAGIAIGAVGYVIYRHVSERIESRMRKEGEVILSEIRKEAEMSLGWGSAFALCLTGFSFWQIYDLTKEYLFSWDKVPGIDSDGLLKYLKDDYNISWVESAEIKKSADCKTIRIFKDKNSSAKITVDEAEENATLKVSDGEIHNLTVEKENGKLNIYKKESFYLDEAISLTEKAYERMSYLDERLPKNEILMCNIQNDLGYYLAARGKGEDREFARVCAKYIKDKIQKYPDQRGTWMDTYDYIFRRYPLKTSSER